ncbi:MAG: flagellar biosynthetic protein FliO [Phycisphaerae bacterium]|nr:flagellar biosynthetic protein FliO [Phycisphaerae bacterium]
MMRTEAETTRRYGPVVWLVAAAVTGAMALPVAVATAQDGPESRAVPPGMEDQRVGDEGGGGIWPWVRTGMALAVVVALVFAARWLLRRWAGSAGGKPPVDVVARSALSARHRLYLVRLGERLVLIGGGNETLTTLAEVTDPDEIAALCRGAGGQHVDADTSSRDAPDDDNARDETESP